MKSKQDIKTNKLDNTINIASENITEDSIDEWLLEEALLQIEHFDESKLVSKKKWMKYLDLHRKILKGMWSWSDRIKVCKSKLKRNVSWYNKNNSL